jgi:opine dehydrogenase
MRVAILGAGAIAYGCAAFLCREGHEPVLWSPSGSRAQSLARGEPLVAKGAVEGRFQPHVASSCEEALRESAAVLIALPVNGHKLVMDAAAPHLRPDQTVLISSHSSFSGLYLSKLLSRRGIAVPIVVWGTTVAAGRQEGDACVNVATVRSKVDAAVLPVSSAGPALSLCRTLFGDRFVERPDMLAIALSNLNPQNHMGIALCNFTRMEKGEQWGQNDNITDGVGRHLEARDAERRALAAAPGDEVRTIREHFHLSFHVPPGTVAEMAQAIAARGGGGYGPTNAETRYVLEDVPYGLVSTALLGRLTGAKAQLHEAGIRIFSALYGRDLGAENNLLPELGLDAISIDELRQLAREGWRSVEADRLAG